MRALKGTSHVNVGRTKLLLDEYGIKNAKINYVEDVLTA